VQKQRPEAVAHVNPERSEPKGRVYVGNVLWHHVAPAGDPVTGKPPAFGDS